MQFCPQCNNLFNITRNKLDTVQLEGGADVYADLIAKIDTLTPGDIGADISLDALANSSAYKKLPGDQQEYVYNVIQSLLPKQKKKVVVNKVDATDANAAIAYFVCTTCGFNKKIEETTLIYSNSVDATQYHDPEVTRELINSNVLWHTSKYICPTQSCPSHTDSSKRTAKFYRKVNSYAVGYICLACQTMF